MGGFLSSIRASSLSELPPSKQKIKQLTLNIPLNLKVAVLKKLNDKSFIKMYQSCWEIHSIFDAYPELFRYQLSAPYRICFILNQNQKILMGIIKRFTNETFALMHYFNNYTLYLQYFTFLELYIEAPEDADGILEMDDPMTHNSIEYYREVGNRMVAVISSTGVRANRLVVPSYLDLDHVYNKLQPVMIILSSYLSSKNLPSPQTMSKLFVLTAPLFNDDSAESFFKNCVPHSKISCVVGYASKNVYKMISALQKSIIENTMIDHSMTCEFKQTPGLTAPEILATFQKCITVIKVTKDIYMGTAQRRGGKDYFIFMIYFPPNDVRCISYQHGVAKNWDEVVLRANDAVIGTDSEYGAVSLEFSLLKYKRRLFPLFCDSK